MTIRTSLFRVAMAGTVLAAVGCSADPPPPPPEPAPRPSFGAWHDTVYADGLGAVVVVNGGPEAGKPATDPLETWAWDGAGWRAVAPAGADGPRWRNFAAIAYDTDRDVLVVHGGLQGRGAGLAETWEWDGAAWTRHPAPGPGSREGAKMAYDAARRLTVLVGGATAAGPAADTWGWDGTTWRRLAAGGPAARFPGPVVYDAARQAVVLYGGHTIDGPHALADTWEWRGDAWRSVSADSAPGPRVNAAATYHAGLGRVVLVAGADDAGMHGDAWSWDGRAWTPLPADGLTPRQAHGLAHDPRRDRLVLTGGLDRPGTAARLQDVWEWDGSAFTRVLA
jgi:hypothetical protein